MCFQEERLVNSPWLLKGQMRGGPVDVALTVIYDPVRNNLGITVGMEPDCNRLRSKWRYGNRDGIYQHSFE